MTTRLYDALGKACTLLRAEMLALGLPFDEMPTLSLPEDGWLELVRETGAAGRDMRVNGVLVTRQADRA